MVRFTPINVTFQYGGRDFTVSGWASVREMFVNGLDEHMIHARMVEPNLDFKPLLIEDADENCEGGTPNEEGDEPNEGQLQEEDVVEKEGPDEVAPDNEDTSLTPKKPHNLEPEDLQRRGVLRERSEDPSEENGLEFPLMKKRRTLELPDDSEEAGKPTYPRRLPGGRWPDEGPSDPQMEIWQEWWDDELQRKFEKETKELTAAAEGLDDRESGIGKEEIEEVDYYKTEYIEWEAKEVIDLVSSSEDSG